MEKILVKGDVYTVATQTECKVTSANGTPLGTATVEAPYTFTATTDRVVLSDPDAEFARVNPKYAPVKLRLLGLLGGGSDASPLPADYIAADFIQFDGNDYVVLSFASKAGDDLQMSTSVQFFKFLSRRQGEGKVWNPQFYYGLENGVWAWALNSTVSYTSIEEDANWHNVKLAYSRAFSGFTLDSFSFSTTYNASATVLPSGLCLGIFLNSLDYAYLRKKKTVIIINNDVKYNLVPAINKSGLVVLFNTITGEAVNSNYKRMRAGLTLAQARKLGQLPSGGGTIRVCLPTNYRDDEFVSAAMAEAEAKGWIFDIDEYGEGAAASTFAFKRVLVRKTPDAEGNYVDANGGRYFVEKTQTIIGADPQELGYEPYRSVDAAVAYWELEPWVDPEAENLLLNQGE